MEKIISLQNTQIKETKKLQQKKYRDLHRKFLIEGIRMVEEGLKYGVLEEFFYDQTICKTVRGSELLSRIIEYTNSRQNTACYEVSAEVLANLAETDAPQGIVAVAVQTKAELSSLTLKNDHGILLIIDGLQDPGNLGTLIRTAWACGTEAAVCLPGTVEAFNGKVVRSTMGSIFRMPLIEETWENTHNWLKRQGCYSVAGDIGAVAEYSRIAYPAKVAVVIGNEGRGLINVKPEEIDYRVKIPLYNEVESLNASVAGGILLYEIIRQRGS